MRDLKNISENIESTNPLTDWGKDRDWFNMGVENGYCILKPLLYEGEVCDENSLSEWESEKTARKLINPKGEKEIYKNQHLIQKIHNGEFVFYTTI